MGKHSAPVPIELVVAEESAPAVPDNAENPVPSAPALAEEPVFVGRRRARRLAAASANKVEEARSTLVDQPAPVSANEPAAASVAGEEVPRAEAEQFAPTVPGLAEGPLQSVAQNNDQADEPDPTVAEPVSPMSADEQADLVGEQPVAVTPEITYEPALVTEESPTEKLAAVEMLDTSVVSRGEVRKARNAERTVAKRQMRARAVVAATSSMFAGLGVATVISGTGQSAAAVTAHVPVTSSLGEAPVTDVSVPSSLAASADASSIDRLRGAREVAAEAEAELAVCQTAESANGMVDALRAPAKDALVMPVKENDYRLSSGYGWRVSPFGGGYHNHLGSDFAAEVGTPIYAIAEGTVEYVGVGKDGRSSNLIIIKHDVNGEVFWSWYVHMYDDGLHVTEGEQVEVGQHIADVGSNGRSTGPHLHLEIHTDEEGTTVNPLGFLSERGAVDLSELCS